MKKFKTLTLFCFLVSTLQALAVHNDIALYEAAGEGNLPEVERLLDEGTNVNVQHYDGFTPLHEAAERGHVHVVELLLDRGANINARTYEDLDGEGRATPLYRAAHGRGHQGHIEVVLLLLQRGANPSLPDEFGRTPFDVTARPEIRALLQSSVFVLYTLYFGAAPAA